MVKKPEHPIYHLGQLGQFYSGSGQDVDYVHMPCDVISRAARVRLTCHTADDLREVLTTHWAASGRRFVIDEVLEWAIDQSTPMGPAEVTANQRHVAVDPDWLRY